MSAARSSKVSTINDVAREAGVSVATVSRALRGLDRVSAQTRERVLQVASDLDYLASPTATSLARGRTSVVGVIVPFLSRWFFATLVSAIEKTLRAHGHHVLLFDLEDDTYQSRLSLQQTMLWKRVDGVITMNLPVDEAELALLDKLHLPVVAIGTPVPGRPVVHIDDAGAVRQATEHLIGLGHRRIAYVGAVPDDAALVKTPQARLDAFHATLREHGLREHASWILASDWTADSSLEHSEALLSLPAAARPTAVVAASDEIAFGVMGAALRRGVRIPEELSVVGIDDHSLSNVMQLTTVRQEVEAQGRLAAELLLRAVLGDESLAEDDSVTVPTALVVRHTTARPSRPRTAAP